LENNTLINAIDNMPDAVSYIGKIKDPSGKGYWGAFLSFKILEYAQ
jgi:hypothetical protein